MVKDSLEGMEAYEIYSEVGILPDTYFAVRVDGRSFHREVQKMALKRPFDTRLRNAMCFAMKAVMRNFGAVFAYTQSDEATFLFPKTAVEFNRRQEKLVSLIAAKMTAYFCKTKIARESGNQRREKASGLTESSQTCPSTS